MKPHFTPQQRATLQSASERSQATIQAGHAVVNGKKVPIATEHRGPIVRKGYTIDLESPPGVDSGHAMTENGN